PPGLPMSCEATNSERTGQGRHRSAIGQPNYGWMHGQAGKTTLEPKARPRLRRRAGAFPDLTAMRGGERVVSRIALFAVVQAVTPAPDAACKSAGAGDQSRARAMRRGTRVLCRTAWPTDPSVIP